jgi:hypothetical protein
LCLWLLLHFHCLHNQSSRIPHQWNRTSCFDDDRVHGGIHVRNWSVLAAWAGKGRSCTKPWARFLALTRGWMFRFLPNVSRSATIYTGEEKTTLEQLTASRESIRGEWAIDIVTMHAGQVRAVLSTVCVKMTDGHHDWISCNLGTECVSLIMEVYVYMFQVFSTTTDKY